ncbi:hypothetical protein IQ283_18700 [Alkalihalobacillus hwajinpoensis]|uniref:hypothetical protein n=1 Tax=Guptibacillus hwajinpoensis TaxID=208199 RepID=UPI0018841D75|nr:hypothetical protein [Pseudalkalibacillus hwajinpoensis]MBF0708631.1 hypothetical protein [Pseudalkalibacillus hwajinpoensis]
MKLMKITGVIAVSLIIFVGGYFTGNLNNNEASREIRIGYQNSDNPSRIDYRNVFKDTENQAIIDNLLMIYLGKEKMKNVNIDKENPDIYYKLISPRQSVSLIDSRVWFTNDGAIIGERSGEGWDQVEYYKLDKNNAKYLKEIIDYKEG